VDKEELFDEKIIQMIDGAENPDAAPSKDTTEIPPTERTIYTGVKIGGQWFYFEPRQFVDGRITMMVPKGFKEMAPEIAKIRYPMEQRPETILTDAAVSVNILFKYYEDQDMSGDEAEMVRDSVFSIIKRMNPGIKPQSTGVELISGKNVAYIEYSNQAMDGKLYNLTSFLEVGGKTLMLSFNCLTKSMKYWQKPAFEMMRSIQVLTMTDDVEGV